MDYYHGSSIPGIKALQPFVSNHERPYVYLTDSEVLAAIYAHNPMHRPNGWFSYCWGKDGTLYYDEYFENQLEEIYRGQQGYVYKCQGEFPRMEKMFWVYLSESAVPVADCREIPDLYRQLLRYEQEGRLVIRRWHTRTVAQKARIREIVADSLKKTPLDSPFRLEYEAYIKAHFPGLV